MSDLSNPKEAASWIDAWREHLERRPGGRERLARVFRQAATEQRTNLLHSRRWCGSLGRAAYEEAIALLEQAAQAAEKDVE